MELLNLLVTLFKNHGYMAVFAVLLLCGFGLPIPEDITLVAGGVISGLENSQSQIHTMFLVGMAGVMLGDSVMFLAGYWKGEQILKFKIISKLVSQKNYESVQLQFEKHGKWLVFMARFMPGLRAAIFLTAGISKKVSFVRFFLTDGFAALISVPVWVYLGYYFATNFEELLNYVHNGQMLVLILLGIALLFGFWMYRRQKKKETGFG